MKNAEAKLEVVIILTIHVYVTHIFFFAFSFSLGSLTDKNSLNTKLMSGFKRYKGKYNKKCEKN